MTRFNDYHVELEMPNGYKDEWDAVSMSDETACQILAMANHRGANASADFTSMLRIYGNDRRPKASLLRSREILIRAGGNVKRDYLKPIFRGMF
jgi:hypothetical protein